MVYIRRKYFMNSQEMGHPIWQMKIAIYEQTDFKFMKWVYC